MAGRPASTGARSSDTDVRRRDEDGAAAVEFALVVPFLLLILFGIVSYAIVFAQMLSLSNSARQAARSAVIEGTTCSQVLTLATDSADTIGMDGTDAAVTVRRGTSDASASAYDCGNNETTQLCKSQPPGTNLYVTMTFSTTKIVPLVPIPDQVSGRGVFRCEFS